MTYRTSPCDFLCRGVRIGASVIDCWQPRDNSHAWYSLRLTSRRSTPLLTRFRSNEESQLPKQAMPAGAKGQLRKHHRPRFYRTNGGRRRRYRCSTCGKTFCSNTGTPYHRLQHRRATFDEVAALSVEGLNKSAIARVKRISWNTVQRWLQRAAGSCRRFNDRKTTGYAITELQADEIRTIIRRKEQPIWIFGTIEVWSRLWPATIVGRRSYRNTLTLFRDISSRMNLERVPLITTDGFTFYAKVIRRVFGPACLYGQVIKTRRNDCIVKVERRAVIGADWRLEKILADSEDSSKLNTSFIERLNLTIRQGSAYLLRRTIIQLPLGWYAEKGGYWGMNSGYDRPDHYGFRRPITY